MQYVFNTYTYWFIKSREFLKEFVKYIFYFAKIAHYIESSIEFKIQKIQKKSRETNLREFYANFARILREFWTNLTGFFLFFGHEFDEFWRIFLNFEIRVLFTR